LSPPPFAPVEIEKPPTLLEVVRSIRASYFFDVNFLVIDDLSQLSEKRRPDYREQMELFRHLTTFSLNLKWVLSGYMVSGTTCDVYVIIGYLPASEINTAIAEDDGSLIKIFEVSAYDKNLVLDSAALFLFFLQSPLQLSLSIFQTLPLIGFKSNPSFYRFEFDFKVLKVEEYPSSQMIERRTRELLSEGISRFKRGDRSRYQYLWRWDADQTMPFHLPVRVDAKMSDESSWALGFSSVNIVAPDHYSFTNPTQDRKESAIDAAREEDRRKRRDADARRKKERSKRKREARKNYRYTWE
jgi:hypothetical protein